MKEVNITNYTVTLKTELSWGDSELIQAEMMSALRLDADARKSIEKAAAKADSEGRAIDEDDLSFSNFKMDGAALLAAKIVAAECLITKIVDDKGAAVPFSKAWLMGLSKADGAKVMAEVDAIRSKTESAEEAEAEIEGK